MSTPLAWIITVRRAGCPEYATTCYIAVIVMLVGDTHQQQQKTLCISTLQMNVINNNNEHNACTQSLVRQTVPRAFLTQDIIPHVENIRVHQLPRGRGGGEWGTLTHSSTCVIVFYLKDDICLCISQLGLRIHLFELCSERFITVYFDDVILGLCIKRFSFFCISHNLINKLIVIRITRLCIIFVLANLI